MSAQDNGGSAFPSTEPDQAGSIHLQHLGMTLRDYFAAKALQGWLASYPRDMKAEQAEAGAHIVAALAYRMADAMLKARQA